MPRIIQIIIIFMTVFSFSWVAYQVYQSFQVHYLGSIAYGQKVQGGYAGMGSTIGTIDGHYQIGLRGDNVIVWREVGEKK